MGGTDFVAISPTNLLVVARSSGLEVTTKGDRIVVRGPRDTDPTLVQMLLARKFELMDLLKPDQVLKPEKGGFPAETQSAQVLQCAGDLVQISGVRGWLSKHDLGPCRTCGSTQFRIGHWRLFCSRCLKANPGEGHCPIIDLSTLVH